MMTHLRNIDGSCQGCLTKLKDAHPTLKDWFLNQVLPTHPDTHIAWSYRGKKEQENCVTLKVSKLQWPHSPHNRRVPIDASKPFDPSNEQEVNSRAESRALDLFQIKEGRGVWDPGFFYRLDQETIGLPYTLTWGGNFKELGDQDHFELKL